MNSEKVISTYKIVRLTAKNITDVERLHAAVYNRQPRPGFFYKKYNTAFTGIEHVGYLAYDRELPIAFYAAIPCFLSVNNVKVLATQSADVMTHPDYRNKGLFVELALTTFQLCRELNVKLLFGFPNQNSLHGFLVRLKWSMTETLDYYNIPTGMPSINGITKRVPFLNKFYTQYQQYVLKDYLVTRKGIENSVFKDGFAGVNRNALYLNYRTYHDTQVIKIGEAFLWVKISNAFIIGDINCREEEFDHVMDEVKKLAIKLGLKSIRFHTSHQTKLSSLFSARYQAVPSFYVLFKDLGARIPLDKIKFTYADVDTF